MLAIEFAKQSRVASETRLGDDLPEPPATPAAAADPAEPLGESPVDEADAEAWLNENPDRLQPDGDGAAKPAPQ